MEEEADWSELPMDLLELIVRRFDRFLNDHVRFGAVCESWRSIAMENRCHIPLSQFPGLMVPGTYEDSPTRCFRRLNHETGYFEEDCATKKLEVPHGCVCRGSAYGWLLLVDDELNMKLLNPFSSGEIQLPSVATLPPPPPEKWFNRRDKWYVDKVVFSSNPSYSIQQQPLPIPPPVILIIYGGTTPKLAYCKLGDEAWTALECLCNHQRYYFLDAIYFKDRFLALDADGEILALDIGTSTDGHCKVNVTQHAYIPGIQHLQDMFLVELQGDLVAVTRKTKNVSEESNHSDDDDDEDEDDDEEEEEGEEEEEEEEEDDDVDDDDYEGNDYREVYNCNGTVGTGGFKIVRFESNEQRWVKLKSLGDNALFLGYNTSFCLPAASEQLGCISNSIYFTNCRGGSLASENFGYDMGIYNLTDKSIRPLYPIGSQLTKPSPIWVTRLPC